jgi:hypothetical protein
MGVTADVVVAGSEAPAELTATTESEYERPSANPENVWDSPVMPVAAVTGVPPFVDDGVTV